MAQTTKLQFRRSSSIERFSQIFYPEFGQIGTEKEYYNHIKIGQKESDKPTRKTFLTS